MAQKITAIKNVLVTGGAGYVGSHTAALLVERGYNVDIVDNLSTGHRAAVPRGAHLIIADLCNQQAVDQIMAEGKYSAVLHFAAHSLVGDSMRNPLKYLGENIEGAISLLRAMERHGIKRFIFSSTANLFGQEGEGLISEYTVISPGSPYGESKYLIERILKWAQSELGIRYTALRYFNAAGADLSGTRGEDHDPETHLIPLILKTALGQREVIEIYGDDYDTPDGTCIRDYIHVMDLAEAHLLCLEALDYCCPNYNLGTGSGYSVRQVINTACEITGTNIPTRMGLRRPGDPPCLVANPERIKSDIGWKPHHSDIRTIIETAWSWHKNNPDGFATAHGGSLRQIAG